VPVQALVPSDHDFGFGWGFDVTLVKLLIVAWFGISIVLV